MDSSIGEGLHSPPAKESTATCGRSVRDRLAAQRMGRRCRRMGMKPGSPQGGRVGCVDLTHLGVGSVQPPGPAPSRAAAAAPGPEPWSAGVLSAPSSHSMRLPSPAPAERSPNRALIQRARWRTGRGRGRGGEGLRVSLP